MMTDTEIKKRIYHAIMIASPRGLSRTEISEIFCRNLTAHRIADAISDLQSAGKVRGKYEYKEHSKGRPREVWYTK